MTYQLAMTHWQGDQRYCTRCSHYHDHGEACRCPDCGQFVPCRTHGVGS
jgi:hypothetical protein